MCAGSPSHRESITYWPRLSFQRRLQRQTKKKMAQHAMKCVSPTSTRCVPRVFFLSSPSLSRTSVLCMSTLPRWKSRWMSVRTHHMATILTTGHTTKKNHLKCVPAIGHRSRRGVCTVFLIHWSRTFCLFALVCVVNARKARLWNEYNVCCRLYYCLLFWKSNTMRMTKSMTRNGIYARRYTNRRWHRLGVYYAYIVSPTKGRRINNSASIGIIVIDNL